MEHGFWERLFLIGFFGTATIIGVCKTWWENDRVGERSGAFAGWMTAGLAIFVAMLVVGDIYNDRARLYATCEAYGRQGAEQSWAAIWAQVGPKVEAAQPKPPMPERSKWTRRRGWR